MKRIATKGHYRTVERDEKGRFTKVKKWSPKQNTDICEKGDTK